MSLFNTKQECQCFSAFVASKQKRKQHKNADRFVKIDPNKLLSQDNREAIAWSRNSLFLRNPTVLCRHHKSPSLDPVLSQFVQIRILTKQVYKI